MSNLGEEVDLEVQINNGKQKNTLDITSNQAVTNPNFVIDYSLKKEEAHKISLVQNCSIFIQCIHCEVRTGQ